jgi:hypothetical protein
MNYDIKNAKHMQYEILAKKNKVGKLFTWELCMWENSTLFLQEFWCALKNWMLYAGECFIQELIRQCIQLPFLHPSHKQRGMHPHPNQWKMDDLCFKFPDIHCNKVQDAGCAVTYNYCFQTSYWWLNTASRQMPHKFKNTTIHCFQAHVSTKI